MKKPEIYTQLLHEFIQADVKAAKVTGNRDDYVALTMAVYVLNLPVLVLSNSHTIKNKYIVLERTNLAYD